MNKNIFNQHFILAGLTAIGISIFYPHGDRSTLVLAQQPSGAIQQNLSHFCKNVPDSRLFVRTELFFGLSKADGSEVTDLEFQQFLNREVTPKFPDGLTLLSGRGQFKNSSGQIIKEPAKLLILIYPLEQSSNSSQNIEQIRKAYKIAFQQNSVLRTDESSCVSF